MNTRMNPRLLTAAVSLGLMLPIARTAMAEDAPAADYTVTGNVALVSDYDFRGITQTWGHAAIQGGGDIAFANGFALGFWGSSLSEKSYPGATLELDLYGSYGAAINDEWSYRVGLYGYVYPGGNLDEAGLQSRSFNTLDANAALTWKWLTLKYSHSLTDYFAIDTEQGYRDDSRGTGYIQLDAALPLNDTWSLALHAGYTSISTELASPLSTGETDPSYADLAATVKYQFSKNWNISGTVSHATNDDFYRHTASFLDASDTRNVGGTRGFVMLQGTF